LRKGFCLIIPFLILASFLNAQDVPPNGGLPNSGNITGGSGAGALTAAEEFRLGIQAYYRYSYNEAILSFERALSFRPGEALILDWLGKAYYRSGFEDTAIMQWRAALDAYGRNSGPGMLLGARIETVTNRRFLLPVADDGARYVESGRYPGKYENVTLYRQPSSILNEDDGSVWVVAYGSNDLVRIDVNGIIRDRRRGPLNGFDRPYDIIRGMGGRLYLSEFRGGRVSVLDSRGNWLSYIGAKGLGDGMFVGPQYLAADEDGYLYVADYGKREISKFDPDGAFILSFGRKSALFPGFLSPTGIAAGGGRIFAADNAAKAIYMFDPNGNYLGRLAAEGLKGPEGMRFLQDGKLLAADANRVLLIDTPSAIVRELGLAGGDKTRITGVDMDRNGNVVACNFAAGEVSVMTRFDDLASGFFVQIRGVSSGRFPLVTVELTVEDRLRRPIVGLDGGNFLLSEGGRIVSEQTFMSPGYRYSGADISILVERSEKTENMRDDLAAAARDISRALSDAGNSRIVSLVSASAQPQRERHENALETAARGTAASFTPRWRFDQGLRMAATDLLPGAPRRSVFYVGSGSVGELAFEQYDLSELACYLANNGITFNAVIVGGGPASAEIDYLCMETGGHAMPLYRPQGIGDLVKNAAAVPAGSYAFTYRSALPTDYGRAFLPLEAEAYLMERSGRDSAGYFPPLE
jgi:DNA-binding beta-propeller fold protein YncE